MENEEDDSIKESEVVIINHRQLVYNGLQCLKCNDIIVSYSRHDFKVCSCGNCTVDGGTDYRKISYNSIDDVKDIVVYDDEPFEKVRQFAYRGTFTKGDYLRKYVTICNMSNEHLAAVLAYGASVWHLKLIAKELEYRHEHGIEIKDGSYNE